MNPTRWRKAGELFHAARDVPDAERRAWLELACENDPELLAEVVSLMESDNSARNGFVERQIAPALASFANAAKKPEVPERVGPYRIVGELGRGGMGTVYLAERDDEQYQTRVAIKLVRRGMDTDMILRRFYRERQTLARLQHPNIARLLDGGTTAEGHPYIVMEYVDGTRITDYCSEKNLGITQRLTLFLDVCKAVDYAHRQFVVHRDLKPGNILVDRSGQVKLLDFGICKLLHIEEQDGAATIAAAAPLLTPDYASPEQILGSPITVASDVYSAAAVLYELLTGTKPHRIEEYSMRGIERAICESDVAPPSAAATKTALSRSLVGDLDNILLHALQTEPARRYPSIERFADDIRRHLGHEPVFARPNTFAYRAGKFLRRRQGLAIGSAAVLLTLSAGVIASMRSARIANENLALVRQLSNTFVFDVYDAVRDLPGSTRARQLIVQTGLEYLDRLSRNASGNIELQKELAAAYQRIGDVQGNVLGANLGNTAGALESYGKSISLWDSVLQKSPNDFDARREQIRTHVTVGGVREYKGEHELALASYGTARQMAEDLLARSPQDLRVKLLLARVHEASSTTIRRQGDFEKAREGYVKAIEILEPGAAAHPEDREIQTRLAGSYSGLGLCEVRAGRLKRALELQRLALATRQTVAKREPANVGVQRELMFAYSYVGDVLGNPNLSNLGDPKGAEEAYRRMAEVARSIHEADPSDQRARSDYGIALSRVAALMPERDTKERLLVLRQVIDLLESVLKVNPGDLTDRAELAYNYNFLGDTLDAAGDRAGAMRAYQESLRLAETVLASRSTTLLLLMSGVNRKLGVLHAGRGERETALAYARKALALCDPNTPAAQRRPAPFQKFFTPRGFTAMGMVHAALASNGNRRAEDAAEARRWLRKSSDTYQELAKLPSFTSVHRREVQNIQKALKELP